MLQQLQRDSFIETLNFGLYFQVVKDPGYGFVCFSLYYRHKLPTRRTLVNFDVSCQPHPDHGINSSAQLFVFALVALRVLFSMILASQSHFFANKNAELAGVLADLDPLENGPPVQMR